jgi:hypothetical protein
MASDKKIDYRLFMCEVFSPEGVLLMKAKMNENKQFYCPGLVPGQDYYLVFSYDEILLEVLLFNQDEPGRVVILSPGHMLLKREVLVPENPFLASIKKKADKRKSLNIPHMGWARDVIDLFMTSGNALKTKYLCPQQVIAFACGSELSKGIKQK